MQKVTMYTTAYCPYCNRAESLLKQRGVMEIHKIRIDEDPTEREIMMARTQRRSVPQIYIGNTYVGGFDELSSLDNESKLLMLLNS